MSLAYITRAFAVWSSRTSLTFTPSNVSPDITITFAEHDLLADALHAAARVCDRGRRQHHLQQRQALGHRYEHGWHRLLERCRARVRHAIGISHSGIAGPSIQDRPVMWPFINVGQTMDDLEPDEEQALAASPYTAWRGVNGVAGEAEDVGSSTSGAQGRYGDYLEGGQRHELRGLQGLPLEGNLL